jgi:SAM-dependent methyltransferase
MGASLFADEISQIVNRHFAGRNDLKLLEAGCGSATHFRLEGVRRSVGIDISSRQLEKNTMIHEKILGDIQTYSLKSADFDLIICWDVIEHLPRPQEALRNMFNALRPGGLAVLGFPHAASFKGIVTKITPYWFHHWFYRHFMKYSSTPFPTYMRLDILPERVIKLSELNGCSVIFQKLGEGGITKKFRKRVWGAGLLLKSADAVWSIVCGGKSKSLILDNCALVLVKSGPERKSS